MTEATQPIPISRGHAQQPPKARPRARRTLRKLLTWSFAATVILVVPLGGAVLVGTYGYFQLTERILPGVQVGDVSLGGMSANEATHALNQRWGDGQTIALMDGQRAWFAPASDLGVTLDAAATVQRAYSVGRGGDAYTEVVTLVNSTVNGTDIPPVARIDVPTARARLNTLEELVSVPPQEGSLRINGGQVVAMPGEMGRRLDVEATLESLSAKPGTTLVTGRLPLMMVQMAPHSTNVNAVLAEAERMLAEDLIIEGYDPITDERVTWTASREEIAAWLAIDTGDADTSIRVEEGRMAAYLDGLSASLGSGRSFDAKVGAVSIGSALRSDIRKVELVVRHAPTSYIVQPGDSLSGIAWDVGIPTWRILEATPGLSVNSQLSVGQVLTIPSPDDLLPLPVVSEKRIVVSIDQQRLWVYENGQVLYEYVISTGVDRSPTQPGVFQVQSHETLAYAGLWDLSMPNFIGIYEAWPGFMNGFHGLPTLSSGQVLWADVLGRPASYGCIILDLDAAETLYNWAEDGVVVEITA